MPDFSKCREGYHPLIPIHRQTVGNDEELVVRWCPQCGAIVVDHDMDGRTHPGHYKKLRYPEITKHYGLNDPKGE